MLLQQLGFVRDEMGVEEVARTVTPDVVVAENGDVDDDDVESEAADEPDENEILAEGSSINYEVTSQNHSVGTEGLVRISTAMATSIDSSIDAMFAAPMSFARPMIQPSYVPPSRIFAKPSSAPPMPPGFAERSTDWQSNSGPHSFVAGQFSAVAPQPQYQQNFYYPPPAAPAPTAPVGAPPGMGRSLQSLVAGESTHFRTRLRLDPPSFAPGDDQLVHKPASPPGLPSKVLTPGYGAVRSQAQQAPLQPMPPPRVSQTANPVDFQKKYAGDSAGAGRYTSRSGFSVRL